MAAWLDGVQFTPTLGGTTDFVVSAAVVGNQTPALAGVTSGRIYKWHAQSADQSQWEDFEGAITGTTVARTTVLYNSSGTGTAAGQSGAGTKINFTTVPTVMCVALKEDMISVEEANSFTTAQKKQAQSNIFVPPTVQTFLSGSGTWTPSTGCLWAEILLIGGAGGNAGSGSGGAGAGGNGGNTTLGGTLLVAGTGAGGAAGNTAGGSGGAPSFTAGPIIIFAIQGTGGAGGLNMITGTYPPGVAGAPSYLGGAGAGGSANSTGGSPATNSGSSGGGSSALNNGTIAGAIGGSGAAVRAIIVSPTALAYAVGAGGSAGTAGTSGNVGIAGAAGQIVIVEHYN